mmetsp:Transcript_59173/g.163756  ORF Transcript_59173/g.163756 Transcript_59173/m.163756 type:complete len:228 (-) Transcript_59173:108-791(-)
MRWLCNTFWFTSRCRRSQSRPPDDFAAGTSFSYLSNRRAFALAMFRISLMAMICGGSADSSPIRCASVPSLDDGNHRSMSPSKCKMISPPATTCSPRAAKYCATWFLSSSVSPSGLPSKRIEGMSMRRSQSEATRLSAAWPSKQLSDKSTCFTLGSASKTSIKVSARTPSIAHSERSKMRRLGPAFAMTRSTPSVAASPAPTSSSTLSGGPCFSSVSKKPSNSKRPE